MTPEEMRKAQRDAAVLSIALATKREDLRIELASRGGVDTMARRSLQILMVVEPMLAAMRFLTAIA